jgi:hypothetical protein
MNKDLIKRIILQSALQHRLIAAGTILLLLALLLYKLMLAPYLDNFNSLRAQLKAQQNLLNLKISRAGSLAKLNEDYLKYEKELGEVNTSFFTEREAEEFMKKLPKIVKGFGNQVVLLQPTSKGKVLTRSEKLKKYALAENLPAEKDLIAFIDNNRKVIDSGETTKDQLIQALRLLPEEKKGKFKEIWDQASDLDFYAGIKLRQVDLEATIQGQFKGILSLLDWFDKYGKIVKLGKVTLNTNAQESGIETRFTLNIYRLLEEKK